jgi:hypothetical protein
LTEDDAAKLDRHLRSRKQFLATEISLEHTLFIFQMGRNFDTEASLREAAQKPKRKRKAIVEI